MTDIHWLSASALASAYRNRTLSPVEVTQHLLARIESLNPILNVFIHLDPDAVLAQAQEAEADFTAGRDRGPLQGIPYGVKDVVDVHGLPTTGHSALLKDHIAESSAPVIKNLDRAGAIVLGKVATHEFAIGGPSFDLPFPPARNPWNPKHHPGGSSSGSGAGVAAGLFPAAVGTDTGGSIRNPAGACGVFGLKATYDKISRDGVFPLSWSLDHVGPLARKVEDIALFYAAMAGLPPIDIKPDIQGLRIGFVRHFHETNMQAGAETAAALEQAASTLNALGASIYDIELPPLAWFGDVNRAILTSEAWTIHGKWLRKHFDQYSALSRRRLLVGAFITAETHLRAQMMRQTLRKQIDAAFEKVDVLLLANSMNPPCRIDDEDMIGANYTQHARTPFNLTGHPAMSVMCGFSKDALPISMQLAAASGREDLILNVAASYQKETGWSDRHPAPNLFS